MSNYGITPEWLTRVAKEAQAWMEAHPDMPEPSASRPTGRPILPLVFFGPSTELWLWSEHERRVVKVFPRT